MESETRVSALRQGETIGAAEEARTNLLTTTIGRTIRSSSIQTILLIVALSAWTALIGVIPGLRIEFFLRGGRSSIETTAVIVAGLATLLAYLQYSLTGARSALFLGLAFASLAVNHLAYGILIAPGPRLGPQTAAYVWTAGRLVAGALLAAAIWERRREPGPGATRSPLSTFLWRTTGALAVLVWLDALVLLLGSSLPPLATGESLTRTASAPLPGLTPINLVLAVAGLIVYFGAAAGAVRPVQGQDAPSPWLPRALILGGFSHLHYLLFPAPSSLSVTTGDFLRVGFVVFLLLALTGEVRRMYLAERDRVKDIERLGRAKDDFFNLLTHELVEPIAALRGYAGSLTAGWSGLPEEDRRAIAKRIEGESIHLQRLGDQAARLARFEARGFSLKPAEHRVIDLVAFAAEAATEQDGRVRLVVEPEVRSATVHVDAAWIYEVFRNLLSNAERYSDPGTPIVLSASWAPERGVMFGVFNEGSGVPPEDIPRLFERFARARRMKNEELPGSGLGLYMCRRVVEAHGGTIWVENESGAGSWFRFTLQPSR